MKNSNHNFDLNSSQSIITYAQKLSGKTLRGACDKEIENHNYSGKGNFGQVLEKFYFGYEPNSDAEPDFKEAGLELKTSPLKKLKNGQIRSKERVVLNIINYLKVHNEVFESSSFVNKNGHILFVFYLYDKLKEFLDYNILIVSDWRFPEEDLKIIKSDWQKINKKIKDGNAHKLSEGDTFYLGACTKGASALKSLRQQPFSNIKAKQRAYSLKQGYVNHILSSLTQEQNTQYGKILGTKDLLEKYSSIEEIVISKFENNYGLTSLDIEEKYDLKLNNRSKNYFSSLTNSILGIQLGKKIEEFEKADVIVKTIRLKENDMPKEDISFPAFKFADLVREEWEDSNFKETLERKFFFVFYKFQKEGLVLKKAIFWNMPQNDIEEAKSVWAGAVNVISEGKIVKEIKGNRRITFFPKKKDNRISHVRPHALNSRDTYPLPVEDKLTGLKSYTKQSFWLNSSYVKSIYIT